MKSKLLAVIVVVLVVLAGCENPWFPSPRGKDVPPGSTTPQSPITITIPGSSVDLTMVWIPAGSFTMGSPITETGRSSNETQHPVTLTKGFYMGIYEVTQEQYFAVMGAKPSLFGVGDKHPVDSISWYMAIAFCNRLSILEGLTPVYSITGVSETDAEEWKHSKVPIIYSAAWNEVIANWSANGYRLPTEAQWEYACRAETTTAYNTGDTISVDTGWYSGNTGEHTNQVGLKQQNAWGLFDMHGNMLEWCWDWYDQDYNNSFQTRTSTKAKKEQDPAGAYTGTIRVIRGGSFEKEAQRLRSAYRHYNATSFPYECYGNTGFRIVRP